ncbi:hypothetical protein [Sulfurimonas sp.]|uniref:hypothetical protein n=1 Tax=Sulfurimonas sp. TaxID=2022749 RepID=UPI0025FC5E73|nr:hypothetical protein [Sulfurimonas sp.]MDD5156592.1 hypothetical protein [Sulfurimonas sp.]
MLLMPEVLTMIILNLIFALFGLVAFVFSLRIYLNWNINATTQLQYQLEKQSFLASTIIKFIFSIKIPLFLFFIFTLDKISNVIMGAMCAAGVVDATKYGTYLIILKILNLYFFAFWLKINKEDLREKNQPYTKQKFLLFCILFLFLIAEIVLETLMFSGIKVDKIVSCCGSIYSSTANSAISSIFLLDKSALLAIFYGNYLLMPILYFFKNRYMFAVVNLVFIATSLISLILFFGTYIYELPSHHCPFCFLQSDYYFVGYPIYSLLFVGTFYGLSVGFTKQLAKNYKMSLLFNSLYVILVSLFAIIYYFTNGVLL